MLPASETSSSRFPPGLRYMVLAAFFFSLMGLLVKLAGQRLPSAELVFARSVVALVLSYGMLKRVGVSPWGIRKGLLFLRGLCGFLSLLCVFYALTHLPLADATVFQYTNPVLTALLGALLLRETLGRYDVIGLVCSLTGVVFVAQPAFVFGTSAGNLDLVAVGIALLGALIAAAAYVTVRKLRETEHPLVVVFYFPLVSTPASIPTMAFDALWPTPVEWLLLLAIGVSTQIAQVYLTKGINIEKAGRAMSMSYVQIVFAALWGVLFFNEVPGLLTLLGALLVIAGTIVVARSS